MVVRAPDSSSTVRELVVNDDLVSSPILVKLCFHGPESGFSTSWYTHNHLRSKKHSGVVLTVRVVSFAGNTTNMDLLVHGDLAVDELVRLDGDGTNVVASRDVALHGRRIGVVERVINKRVDNVAGVDQISSPVRSGKLDGRCACAAGGLAMVVVAGSVVARQHAEEARRGEDARGGATAKDGEGHDENRLHRWTQLHLVAQ